MNRTPPSFGIKPSLDPNSPARFYDDGLPDAQRRFKEARDQKQFVGSPKYFEIIESVNGFGFELGFEDAVTGDMDFMRGVAVFEKWPPSPDAVAEAFRRLGEECSKPFDSQYVATGEQELTDREIRVGKN